MLDSRSRVSHRNYEIAAGFVVRHATWLARDIPGTDVLGRVYLRPHVGLLPQIGRRIWDYARDTDWEGA